MTEQIIRRAGGRSARRSARNAPLADHLRPVRAGLEGGRFNPLSPQAEDRINSAVLDALEQIGLADAPPSGIEYMTNAGAILGNDEEHVRCVQGLQVGLSFARLLIKQITHMRT